MLIAAVSGAAGLLKNSQGLVNDALSFINPGAVRDEHRQARVNWMEKAAVLGSVLAASIIKSAPANVAGNEDAMWEKAALHVQTQVPAVWARASSSAWPVGAPFDMPNERARIVAELDALGAQAPAAVIPDAGPQGEPVNLSLGTSSKDKVNQLANSNGYQIIPTKYIVGGLLIVAAGWFLLRHSGGAS